MAIKNFLKENPHVEVLDRTDAYAVTPDGKVKSRYNEVLLCKDLSQKYLPYSVIFFRNGRGVIASGWSTLAGAKAQFDRYVAENITLDQDLANSLAVIVEQHRKREQDLALNWN